MKRVKSKNDIDDKNSVIKICESGDGVVVGTHSKRKEMVGRPRP